MRLREQFISQRSSDGRGNCFFLRYAALLKSLPDYDIVIYIFKILNA